MFIALAASPRLPCTGGPWRLASMIGRLLCVCTAITLSGSPPAAATRELAVIPPGHEELFAAMLGLGAGGSGACAFAGAAVDRTLIRARYLCAGEEIAVELRHPQAAPDAVLRTERFAVVAVSGGVPPALLAELEAQIRAREAGFAWSTIPIADGGAEEETSYFANIRRALSIGALVLVTALALGWRLWRRLRRRAPTAAVGGFAATATSAGLAVLLCGSGHAALWLTGESFSAMLRRAPLATIASRAAIVAVLAVVAALCAGALARFARSPASRLAAASLVIGYVVVGYARSLAPDDLHHFGPLSTYPPNTTIGETLPGQAPVTYGINRLGFRAPDFAESKADEQAIRVVVIGDSFVFGIGVDDDATLHRHLAAELERRWPARSFEVLNLGIPGNNLSSHVTMYATAVQRLEPDAIVLALTFANDLSRWDEQDARRDARRLGAFSFARFLFGEAAESIWALLFLERSTTPAGLEHLDGELRRLAEMRRSTPNPPLLVLFGFQPWDPPVAERLKLVTDAVLVPNRQTRADEFIPGDGHPTSLGNARSSAHIARTLAESRAWQRLVGRPRDQRG
jgi:hypothetical protein